MKQKNTTPADRSSGHVRMPADTTIRQTNSLLNLITEVFASVVGPRFFIQVGSNTGMYGDPVRELVLRDERWHGILIEPVKYLFEQLKANYGHVDRFIFENVAISEDHGERPIYYVDGDARHHFDESLPYWYEQLGSFNRSHLLNYLNGGLEPFIVEETVETMPLSDLCKKHNIKQVHFLHIDTEGHDFVVLQTMDFDAFRPSMIVFEHEHLNDSDCSSAYELLTSYGYELSKAMGDTIGLLKS